MLLTHERLDVEHGRGLVNWLQRMRRDADDRVMANLIASRWRDVAQGVGAGRMTSSGAGIPVELHPRVTHVQFGPETTLIVRLLPGQTPGDLRRLAGRLAFGMGAALARVESFRGDWVKVRLLDRDPIADVVPPEPLQESPVPVVLLGNDERGSRVEMDLSAATHLIAQGVTGSGKSVGCYSWLSSLAAGRHVRVTGVDPTGLLLGPWANRWMDVPAPALGTSNPFGYAAVLDMLVKEMDRRIGALPRGRDQVEVSADCPLIVCALEEYPGILRVLDQEDKKLGATFRALVGRLLGEGRKAGIRVWLITQRAEAEIIGGYERGQASHRISFRVDSVASLRMLHLDATPELAAEHATASPGVALLSAPGVPLVRLKAPYMTYPGYVDLVDAAA